MQSQMSQTTIDLIIAGITVVVSVVTSAFVAGTRFGEMKGDMKSLQKDISEIKGMFVLRLRDHDDVAK
jgi:hypothetical protein